MFYHVYPSLPCNSQPSLFQSGLAACAACRLAEAFRSFSPHSLHRLTQAGSRPAAGLWELAGLCPPNPVTTNINIAHPQPPRLYMEPHSTYATTQVPDILLSGLRAGIHPGTGPHSVNRTVAHNNAPHRDPHLPHKLKEDGIEPHPGPHGKKHARCLNPPLPSLSLQIAPVWKQIPMYSPQEKITTSSLTKPRPPTPQSKSMKGRFANKKRTILFGPTDPEFSRPSAGVRVITRNPRVTGPYVCFFVVSVCVCVCVCARAFFVHKMAAVVL